LRWHACRLSSSERANATRNDEGLLPMTGAFFRRLRTPLLQCAAFATWVLCVVVILCFCREVNATEEPRAVPFGTPNHYCGVSCLFAASRIWGIEYKYDQLLQPLYIGSARGSTIAELKKAAEDRGLFAIPVTQAGRGFLESCPHPVILHVKKSDLSSRFNHYELFLGSHAGQALVYSPPKTLQRVPLRSVMRRWDGTGLVLSREPLVLSTVFGSRILHLTVFVLASLCFVAVARQLHSRYWNRVTTFFSVKGVWAISLFEATGLVVFSCATGLGYQLLADDGMLSHPQVTSSLFLKGVELRLPTVSLAQAMDLAREAGAVLVDARRSEDYKMGHIARAINIPAGMERVSRLACLSNVSHATQIIVYCQSRTCPYARSVAGDLVRDGYENIFIFEGGWVEWEKTVTPKCSWLETVYRWIATLRDRIPLQTGLF